MDMRNRGSKAPSDRASDLGPGSERAWAAWILAAGVLAQTPAALAVPPVKGDLTQIIAGPGVAVSPGGDQSGPVAIGVTKAPDSDLLDGLPPTAFGRTTSSGTTTVPFESVTSPLTLPVTGVQVHALCHRGTADSRDAFSQAVLLLDAGVGASFASVFGEGGFADITGERTYGLTIAEYAENDVTPFQRAVDVRSFVLEKDGKTISITAGAQVDKQAGCALNWQATESE